MLSEGGGAFLNHVPPFTSGIGLVPALIAAAVVALFTLTVFAARGVLLSDETLEGDRAQNLDQGGLAWPMFRSTYVSSLELGERP